MHKIQAFLALSILLTGCSTPADNQPTAVTSVVAETQQPGTQPPTQTARPAVLGTVLRRGDTTPNHLHSERWIFW